MKRIKWVDIARYIGIMFVMFSHSQICPEYLRVFFSPFYLSIFFFVSGYLYKNKDDFKTMILKRARQIVLPWFIYSNLNIILSNIKSFKHHQNDFVTELFRNLLQIRFYDERLWFLPAMFVAYIPFYFIEKHYRNNSKSRNSVLVLVFMLSMLRSAYKTFMNPDIFPWKLTSLPWHIDYIPTSLLFMVLGMIFKHEWEEHFDKNNTLINRIILSVIYIGFIYLINPYEPQSFILDNIIDNTRHILGLIFIVSISKVIKDNAYMSYIGANTLIYFCIHNKVVTLFEVISKYILKDNFSILTSNPVIGTIACTILTLIVSLVLIIPTKFINKYLPWTVGR